MVDLDILAERGVSAKAWQKIFKNRVQGPGGELVNADDKVHKFVNRMRSRIVKGREQNFSSAKFFYALDQAWDTPLKQISPTLLRSLSEPPSDNKDVTKILKEWGFDLASVFVEELDPKTKKNITRLNVDAFFKVVVPLVKAYVTIRWAKLTNDRRRTPFLAYEPEIDDEENRVKAEVLTTRINVMASQLGYFQALKQAVLKMLLYSFCLEFPMEEWYRERQLVGPKSKIPKQKRDLAKDAPKKNGKEREKDPNAPEPDDEYKTIVVREGVRYTHPHPSRVYWDRSHPLSSFNTDSGSCYAGFWKVMRFGELKANKAFYNLDKLSYGSWQIWAADHAVFFNTVYPCVMNFPVAQEPENDREAKQLTTVYSDVDEDKSVVTTEHYERLVPSECGLGDYDFPIWARFVLANDDTPIYAAPMAYAPVTMYGYDLDESRDMNPSLALEIVPWQDQFSNILTQIFLTAKQNLTNVTFVDTDQVDSGIIASLANWGERAWRVLNWIPFSAKKAARGGQGIPNAFYSHRFPAQDTTQLMGALRLILDTLERVLVMSSQEVAQAASHEQTREEVRNIKENTSTRLQFTAFPIDDALQAKKVQLYHALMAHGEEEFYAQIPIDTGLSKERLEEMGFTVSGEDSTPTPGQKTMTVKTNKTAVAITSFISVRDESARENNVEAARAMAEILREVMSNPVMLQALGPDQLVSLLNQISSLAGLPKDFKFKNIGPNTTPEQQATEQQKQLAQMAEQIIQKIEGDMKAGLEPVLDQVAANTESIKKIESLLETLTAVASNAPTINDEPGLPPVVTGGVEIPPGMAPPPGSLPPPEYLPGPGY